MNSVRGSSVCGQPSELGLLCCHGTTTTGFLCIEETRSKTDRKRETRGNRSSSQLGVKKMSIKHIIYTERFQTDKSSYVFHPIAIPATSFKNQIPESPQDKTRSTARAESNFLSGRRFQWRHSLDHLCTSLIGVYRPFKLLLALVVSPLRWQLKTYSSLKKTHSRWLKTAADLS